MSTIRVVNLQHTDATEPNIVLLEDGTSVFASGITISGGTNLTVSGTAEFASGTVSAPGVTFIDDNNTGLYSPAADTVAITTAATERVRVDNAGNVGLGTSAPYGVSSTGNSLNIANTSSSAEINFLSSTTGFNALYFGDGATGTDRYRGYLEYAHNGDYMRFATATTERLRIDSSGKVGIGTASPSGLLSIHEATSSTSNYINITNNATGASSWSNGMLVGVDATGEALCWQNENNIFKFGTNNAERMRIDSSGKVGIGTSSPGEKLHVSYASGSPQLILERTGSATGKFSLGASSNSFIFKDEAQNAERMRIDSSGNVGIGNTDPGALLQVSNSSDSGIIRVGGNNTGGTGLDINYSNSGQTTTTIKQNFRSSSSAALLDIDTGIFTVSTGTSGTERMRIDSSGSLLVGRTSAYNSSPGEVAAFQGDKHGVVIFNSVNANYTCLNLRNAYANNSGNNVSGNMITFHDNGGTERGKIATNGSSTSYITSSDYRLKENVVPLIGAINRINKFKVHRFNFIGISDSTVDGFLAHEAQTVVPEAVTGTKDEVDDDGKAVMQGIDQAKLVPLLTAALQEAIGRIETLETEVAALKNN